MSHRALVVSLHDVSPRTSAACRQAVQELTALGAAHLSLLVIPDHHHNAALRSDPALCVWLGKMARAGHELVLHGYYHLRAQREREGFLQRLTTRVYTAGEGEFYDLDRAAAAALLQRGRADFHALQFHPAGFIAPAWLLSRGAENALRDQGLEYTTRLGSVLDLKARRRHRSQSLVWSVRSAWRRRTSLAWNAYLFRRLAKQPLLRISVHPADLAHPRIWQQIKELISTALRDREPVTYYSWVQRERARRAIS